MAKFFETSADIVELAEEIFEKTSLNSYGLQLKVMSVGKSKDVVKVSKANPTTEFLTKKEGIIQLQVYEAAFERLDDEARIMFLEMAFSNISYDLDKDKINVDNVPFHQVFRMRAKYGETFLNKLELGYIIIDQIEEENKARKEEEKAAKSKK